MNKEKSAESIELTRIDVAEYEIRTNSLDFRKDLHVYVNHVGERTIKRSVRENKIPKADIKRIAKLLSDPEALGKIDEWGDSYWVNFVDELALALGFIDYDREGVYQGYTSSEPSFPDNYIEFNEQAYKQFITLPLLKQEQLIFDVMVGDYSGANNEFISEPIFGQLDGFSRWGCATGVMPYLAFDKARKFLFDCLKSCQAGIWYDTASLVRYLKNTHPFFLIPQKPRYKYQYESKQGRYGNFHEKDKETGKENAVSEKARDAFERVEGRFIERFLEDIPLTLGYVDVAYGAQTNPGQRPSLGRLKGFKVNQRYLRFVNGQIAEPRVMIQPNHEIHVESECYPASMVERLTAFSDLVSTDRMCIFKLNRQKAVQYMAGDESADLKKFLGDLGENALPANIATELDEWAGHSETFVLYQGFGLIEGSKLPSFVNAFEVETLSCSLRLVHSPDALFAKLEMAEQVPVLVTHRSNALKAPPEGLKSVFTPKVKKAGKSVQKALISIKRKTYVTLFFQTSDLLDIVVKALVREKCPVEVDKERLTATYASEHKKRLDAAIKKLKKTYRIKIGE